MTLDRRIVTLLACLTVGTVVGVWYAVTHHERTQSYDDDDNDTDAEPGTFASTSLKSVTVVFRHGDRSPAFDYKTFPNIYENNFPEGKGQLTKIGKQHMYQKGKLFRRLYNGFISDLYLDHEILVKTTKYSRTFMSAAMVLAGMYPPKYYQKWSFSETVWQPIPISNDSPDQTMLFRNGSCPYTIWFMKNDNDVIINNYNETQIEELLSHLSEKCGIPINIEAMFDLYDLFKSMISNELQLPEWINHEQFQLMELIYYEQTRRVYNNKKIQNIIIGPLIKQISLNMELQSNSPDYIKTKNNMHLYAGHDMTLGTMMYFLGNNKIKLPDFGASAHFHLYLNKTIKVFYYNKWDNENGEEMSIPKCGYSCNLDDFVNLINNEMSTEWEQDCQIEGN